ncbi:alpha/beta fold hydrolase [Demequina sp.]|uniref:alpha/beta fold hydrolase n=1 Tax=Demequina sp. TaxID=2050685 RepID=UPI003A88F119
MGTGPSRRDDARYRAAETALWEQFGLVPTELWVEVADLGLKVRALVVGPDEGRPVVFVHGTPTAGGVWAPLVARLRGVRAVVVDRPGCALSEPMDLTRLTPQSLRDVNAAWLGELVSALDAPAVDVVGNSAGGMAAIMFAASRPNLVRSLVLDGVPAVSGMRLPPAMRAATMPWVARAVSRHTVTAADLRRSFRSMGHGRLFDSGGLSAPEIQWRTALSTCTDTFVHELALLAVAANWRGPRRAWVPGPREVGALAMRSLWAVGDKDPFANPERVRRWARRAPHSEFTVLEGCGHQPWLDDPEGHARMLEQWWQAAGHTPRRSSPDSQAVPR